MAAPANTPTPLPTRIALVVTLAVTATTLAAFVARRSQPADNGTVAACLLVLSVLFVIRVAAQVLVRTRAPRWLPPTDEWNLSPYHLLLPTQLAIVGLLAWIDADFARGRGFWTVPRPALGRGVLGVALVYATAMVIRYVVQMTRRPEHRWFGGAIPIFFHWVLAAYLFVFGSYHASH